jgi:hypothetical protein
MKNQRQPNQKFELTCIGYYSFETKRIYKTKLGLKIAEKKRTMKIKLKNEKLLDLCLRTIQQYKDYAKQLMKTTPSFNRWSNIKECIVAIKEEIVLLPKYVRGAIDFRIN